jgi:hypothetical protein
MRVICPKCLQSSPVPRVPSAAPAPDSAPLPPLQKLKTKPAPPQANNSLQPPLQKKAPAPSPLKPAPLPRSKLMNRATTGSDRSRLLLLAAAGVGLIFLAAVIGLWATGAFRSHKPVDPEAEAEEERLDRFTGMGQVLPPAAVQKLLAELKPQNKPGSVRPHLKGKVLIVGVDITNDLVSSDASANAADLRRRCTGPDDDPWKFLVSAEHLKTAKLDPIMLQLPDELWAVQLKQAGTIIWIRWWKQAVGRYGPDGKRADAAPKASEGVGKLRPVYQWFACVTPIDRATADVLDVKMITGASPPAVIPSEAPAGLAPKPTGAVLKYLVELPRE